MRHSYTFPSEWPDNCPPEPHNEMCGIYYRLAKSKDKSDPKNFKSHHELGLKQDMEQIDPCGRRGLSMNATVDDLINLWKMYPRIGKYIAFLNLSGGHGVVAKVGRNSHHNWWVPNGVAANSYCSKIEEIEA